MRLDMAVVVDLDAVERALQPERGRDTVEQLRCEALSASRRPSASRAAAAIRSTSFFLSPRRGTASVTRPAAQRQRFRDQLLLDQRMAQQDQRRFRPIVIELADEGGQHVLDRSCRSWLGKYARLPQLWPPRKKNTWTQVCRRPDAPQSRRHRRCRRRECPDGPAPVTARGCGRGSAPPPRNPASRPPCPSRRKGAADVPAAAGQKVLRLVDQPRIVRSTDAADARRAAALDLEQQAGPGAVIEDAVAARPQQKGFLQRNQVRLTAPAEANGPK